MSEKLHKILDNSECPDESILRDYADGKLSKQEQRLVEEHLSGCEMCGDVVEGMMQVSQTEAEQTLKDVRFTHTPANKNTFFTWRFAVAASILIVSVLSYVVYKNLSTNKNSTEITLLNPVEQTHEKAEEQQTKAAEEAKANELVENEQKNTKPPAPPQTTTLTQEAATADKRSAHEATGKAMFKKSNYAESESNKDQHAFFTDLKKDKKNDADIVEAEKEPLSKHLEEDIKEELAMEVTSEKLSDESAPAVMEITADAVTATDNKKGKTTTRSEKQDLPAVGSSIAENKAQAPAKNVNPEFSKNILAPANSQSSGDKNVSSGKAGEVAKPGVSDNEFLQKGYECLQKNKTDCAIEAFEKAAQSANEKIAETAKFELGLIYKNQGNKTKAKYYFEEVIKHKAVRAKAAQNELEKLK